MNLRNIAWHGFLSPHDCTEVYSKLLLLIILSLGRDFEATDIEISYRPFLKSPIESFSLIKQNFNSNFDPFDFYTCENDTYLTHSKKLYKSEKYGRALLFLLIRIETHVRQMFADTNPTFDPRARIDSHSIWFWLKIRPLEKIHLMIHS